MSNTVQPSGSAPAQKVWVLEAEHPIQPGRRFAIYGSAPLAHREAADLTNIMLKDCGKRPTATIENWSEKINRLRESRADDDFYVTVTENVVVMSDGMKIAA